MQQNLSILKLNHEMKHLGHSLKTPVLLLFRLFWGMLLLFSGVENYIHQPFLVELLRELQFPTPHFLTYLFILAQLITALSLLLGFLTGLIMPLLVMIMLIALLTVHSYATWHIFDAPHAFIIERPVTYLIIGLVILVFGPGDYSLDQILNRHFRKE